MRKKKERHPGEVELNLAAMLDMAFQLLTFFILTFRPAPVEGQVLLRMPLPQPVTSRHAGVVVGNDPANTDPLLNLKTLTITALAQDDGSLKQLALGETAVGSLAHLDRSLQGVLEQPGSPFDQVIIQVDSRLQYNDLMQAIDVCTRQKLSTGERLSKLSFVELPVTP